MARWARIVIPRVWRRVMQRRHRRQETFFDEEEYATYLALPSGWCGQSSRATSQNDGRNEYDVRGIHRAEGDAEESPAST